MCEDAGRPSGQSVGSPRQWQRRQDGDGLSGLQHHCVGGKWASTDRRKSVISQSKVYLSLDLLEY